MQYDLSQRYINSIGKHFKIYEHVMERGGGMFEGLTSPMVDFGAYEFKYINTGKISPEEYYMSAYVEKVFELEHLCTHT